MDDARDPRGSVGGGGSGAPDGSWPVRVVFRPSGWTFDPAESPVASPGLLPIGSAATPALNQIQMDIQSTGFKFKESDT